MLAHLLLHHGHAALVASSGWGASAPAIAQCAHTAAAAAASSLSAAAAAGRWERLRSHSTASTSGSSGAPGLGCAGGDAAAAPPEAGGGAPRAPRRPDLVEQLLAAANMSRREQLMQRKASIMQQFQRAPGDLGSPEVQVALLTEKIRDASVHVLAHKKDHVSKRGLQAMLNQRRKLLAYLRRDNFPRYAFVIHQLGLKDVYAKQARYDKYRVGTRLGTPAEPLKRYGNK